MAILIAPDDTATPRTNLYPRGVYVVMDTGLDGTTLVNLDAMTYGLGIIQDTVVEQQTTGVFVRGFFVSPPLEIVGNTGGQHSYGHA